VLKWPKNMSAALVKTVLTDKAVVDENNKRLVLGCGALVYDLLRLLKQNPSFSVESTFNAYLLVGTTPPN